MVKKKGDKEEQEEEETPKKAGWEVKLVVIDENQPPKKVLVKGEKTLDNWAALAEILNELEQIRKALLN